MKCHFKSSWTNILQNNYLTHNPQSSKCCLNTFERTLYGTTNYLCNVGPERRVIFSQEYNPSSVFLICLGEHYTRKLPVQCWSTVHKQLSSGKKSITLSGSIWDNIAQENYLCNVGPWLTDNVYEENNLYNVVSTMLIQHYIKILSNQCFPNTPVTRVPRVHKYVFAGKPVVVSMSANLFFIRVQHFQTILATFFECWFGSSRDNSEQGPKLAGT